jgi:hypothetical protein
MLYRLAFQVTDDGYLRVTGGARDSPVLSALHLNDKVFGAAVRAAQMAPFQTLRLLEAAREAGKQPGVEICCEAVELTQEQVEVMCLQSGRAKIADSVSVAFMSSLPSTFVGDVSATNKTGGHLVVASGFAGEEN